MIARLIVLAAAVVAVVLLTGSLRTARDVERGAALIEDGRAPARVDEALALLHGAAGRTANTTPLVRAAELQLFTGRDAGALADGRSRAEPPGHAGQQQPRMQEQALPRRQVMAVADQPMLAGLARPVEVLQRVRD